MVDVPRGLGAGLTLNAGNWPSLIRWSSRMSSVDFSQNIVKSFTRGSKERSKKRIDFIQLRLPDDQAAAREKCSSGDCYRHVTGRRETPEAAEGTNFIRKNRPPRSEWKWSGLRDAVKRPQRCSEAASEMQWSGLRDAVKRPHGSDLIRYNKHLL